MAFPKKTSRNMVINDIEYTWMASGNDNIINLIISLKENSGQKLMAQFHYVTIEENELTEMQITPDVVRKVIDYGILNGWKGKEKGKDLQIGVMNYNID